MRSIELRTNSTRIKTIALWLATALLMAMPLFSASAGSLYESVNSGLTNTGTGTGLGSADITVTVGNVIKAFLGLIGIVLVVFFIYAGFLWMTAGGNEEKVSQAKDIIKNAVIGMVILMMAYAITSFVITAILRGTGAEGAPE